MRQIGTIQNETEARRFSDFLLSLTIDSRIEKEGDDWGIWIIQEDDLERAREEFKAFLDEPNGEQYRAAVKRAAEIRQAQAAQRKATRDHFVDVRAKWQRAGWQAAPVTHLLILASVLVAMLTTDFRGFPNLCNRVEPLLTHLYILPIHSNPDRSAVYWWNTESVATVLQRGEVWRLVTPMLIHANILHLFFNMMFLQMFGTMIERRGRSLLLLAFVLGVSALGNLMQYKFSGPYFGGMSGVGYGLFGYLWIRSRVDPRSGYYLHPNTVFLMLGWFVLCLTGMMRIANYAHSAGLALGMAAGYLRSLSNRRSSRTH